MEDTIFQNLPRDSEPTDLPKDQFAPQIATGPIQPPPQTPKKFPVIGVVTGIVIVLAVIIGGVIAQNPKIITGNPAPNPTLVAPPPSPTPERQLSFIASQSAFIQIETNVASLSGSIQNIIVSDPSLSPPVLDLPLGFSY